MWVWFHKLGSPRYFWRFSEVLLPWIAALCLIGFTAGLLWGLVYSPADYEQQETVRIMYVHVPVAILSLMIYVMMAVCGAVLLIWRMKMAEIVAYAAAPIGAALTFLALATGSIWGKPMWGTWWQWEARLTSELVLLFFYIGYIALYNAIEDKRKAGRSVALLALATVVIVPVVKYSVTWWYTLHQGSTTKGAAIAGTVDSSMRMPLFVMLISFVLFFTWVLFKRIRAGLLDYDRDKRWAKELAAPKRGLWVVVAGIVILAGVTIRVVQFHNEIPFYSPSQLTALATQHADITDVFVTGEKIQKDSVKVDKTTKLITFNLEDGEQLIAVEYHFKDKAPYWLHDRQRIRVEGTLASTGTGLTITADRVYVNYYRYIWSVYIITLILVIASLISAWHKERALRIEILRDTQRGIA